MNNAANTKYFTDGLDKDGFTKEENQARVEGLAWAEESGSDHWRFIFLGLRGEKVLRAAIENWILD